MTSSLSPVADDLIWFKDSSIGGRRDPLLFAQEWFQQKEERNRALAIKQKEVEEKRWHDEEQAQRLAQHSDGTKPLPTKSGNHVDFHGAAGMYPTPPDGINASAMRGPLSVDATGSTPGDLVRTASYSGDVDMAGNEDHADLEVSRDSEMYDDMEDALFGENGVTEADFSFFDQPDFDGVGGDLNMMGGSDFMEDIETHNQDVAEAGNSHVPGHSASEYEATVESKTVTEHDIQENSEAGAALEQNSARDHRGLPHELDIDRLGPGQQHQKLASPPYSPGQIMKILLPDKDSAPDQSDQGATEYAARRLKSKLLHSNRSAFEQNSFTSIALNRSILSFDEKYSLHGRYGSQAESSVDHRSRRTRPDLSIIPTIGFPKRISRYRQLPNYSTEKSNKHEGHHLQATKNALDTPPDEDSSPESDQDDTSYTTGEDCRRSKRKRPTDDDDISMTSTPYSTGFEAGRPAMTKEDYDELLMDISLHNHDDEDAEIPSESKRYNQNGSMTLTECNFVDIAQIITDQATSRFLPFRMSHDSPLDDHVDSWSLEDIEVTKIPPPHIQVRRADGPLDLLPPAISFWETFGFSPYGGPKDVLAFCVYPPAEGLDEAVKVFAERMSSTYRSCRLGEHRWGSLEHPSEAFAPIGYAWTGLDAPLERSTVIKAMVNECTRIGKSPCRCKVLANIDRNRNCKLVNHKQKHCSLHCQSF
jgi:mediator of RNA polymerase II transcription subunit 13